MNAVKTFKSLILVISSLSILWQNAYSVDWEEATLQEEKLFPVFSITAGVSIERIQYIKFLEDEYGMDGVFLVDNILKVAGEQHQLVKRSYYNSFDIVLIPFSKYTREQIYTEVNRIMEDVDYIVLNDWEDDVPLSNLGDIKFINSNLTTFYEKFMQFKISPVFRIVELNGVSFFGGIPQFLLSPFSLRSEFNGQMRSTWLGTLDDFRYPWVWHPELGWLYISDWANWYIGKSRGYVITYFDLSLNRWFYIEEANYPWIYSFDNNKWLYYLKGSRENGKGGWWYDSGSADWIKGP